MRNSEGYGYVERLSLGQYIAETMLSSLVGAALRVIVGHVGYVEETRHTLVVHYVIDESLLKWLKHTRHDI